MEVVVDGGGGGAGVGKNRGRKAMIWQDENKKT